MSHANLKFLIFVISKISFQNNFTPIADQKLIANIKQKIIVEKWGNYCHKK